MFRPPVDSEQTPTSTQTVMVPVIISFLSELFVYCFEGVGETRLSGGEMELK